MPFSLTKISRSATLPAFFLALMLTVVLPAHAQTETVLYSFCSQSGCSDGSSPFAGLIMDKKGNLYGTTFFGGANCADYGDCGTVFKLTPSGSETVLYSFCTQSGCSDGREPVAGLIMDKKGNLYGTTSFGGAYGYGTVFKLTRDGIEAVLYSFCAHAPNCTDGAMPLAAGLILDKEGNLYGTTPYGGTNCTQEFGACGTLFKLTPAGQETVLYSFCSQSDCSDGAEPLAGVIMDKKGNLYGTTAFGGASPECGLGCGTVFKVTPAGKETVLYSFGSQSGDGYYPEGLIMDKKGNLYGTTGSGGANHNGTVFKMTPTGTETVLYSFCSQSGCSDGAWPQAGVIMDEKGNLYGTTIWGGNLSCPFGDGSGCGVAFRLTPAGKETVLYTLCSQSGCTDGASPYGGLIMDKEGNLYGTTNQGGAYGAGTAFKVTP